MRKKEEKKRDTKECNVCGRYISLSNFAKHVCNPPTSSFVIEDEWKMDGGNYQCPLCDASYSKMGLVSHYWRCHTEQGKKRNKEIIEKAREKSIESGSWSKGQTKETNESIRKGSETRKQMFRDGRLKPTKHKHTQETKDLLSRKQKEFLKKHPEQHNWAKKNRRVSVPCEAFKKKLSEHGIMFVSEVMPLEERFFKVDVAFPDIKVAIEINGNQHYENDGITLKPYYAERHRLIENVGWKIHEIHYSLVYNESFIEKIVNDLKGMNIDTTNYDVYKKKLTKKEYFCASCGKKLFWKTITGLCVDCYGLTRRKVVRPPYEQLLQEVKDTNFCVVGRKYGVSDNAIRKWIDEYERNMAV